MDNVRITRSYFEASLCGREDLNLHALRHSLLKTARIPNSATSAKSNLADTFDVSHVLYCNENQYLIQYKEPYRSLSWSWLDLPAIAKAIAYAGGALHSHS